MKTLTGVVLFFIAVTPVFGQPQLEKGVYSVSGSVSFSSVSSSFQDATQKTTSFELSPSISFFVADKFEVTFVPNFTTSSSETSFPGQPLSTSSSRGVGLGLAVRYYFPIETVAPFVGLGGGLTSFRLTVGGFSTSSTSTTKTYGFVVGFDYFVTQAFAIEPQVQYHGTKMEASSSSGILLIGVGVKYFIL